MVSSNANSLVADENTQELEVFREDIPRATYVNSDRVTAVSGCSYLFAVNKEWRVS